MRPFTIGSALGALVTSAAVLLPPPDMTVSQWADAYRVLSREDSAAPGRWSSDSRPYQRGIMDAASSPRIQYVTVVGGAQWGKTQILNNILGQRICLNPGPIMVVAPTERAAEKWSKTRFAPMVRDCPELAALIGDRSRDSSNTILEKTFPGGLLVAVGANAPAGLASQPIRDLLIDEVDRIPKGDTVEGEGDFEDLAEARTSDFEGRRLIYKCSTPTILGQSRIEDSWKESDQQFWNVTCPHCGFEQTLTFKNVVFKDLPEPVYACHGGGCQITEPELRRAVKEGRWIATRPDVVDHAGFWVHGLMIRPMATLVSKFKKAMKKGIGPLQTFTNTQLGEWWNPRDGDTLQVEGLQKRARESGYTSGQVPDGVGILVAAVDVQDDRLELLVQGVGTGEETWRITREIIPGNLTTAPPWDHLEEALLHLWARQSGGALKVRLACIDIGGHFTKEVYKFCRRPKMRGICQPVKGATRPQLKLAVRSGGKARLWLVDTVQAKDQFLHRLKIETPGYGYCHFPDDLDRDYFEQLLAEHRKSGKRLYEKITTDARNEALDLEVYSMAALFIASPKDLEALVLKAGALAGQVVPAADPEPVAAAPAPVPEERPRAPDRISRVILPRIPRGGGGNGAW